MLLVVDPGLLIVEDSTLGYASVLWIEFFRLEGNSGERDSLLVLEECLDALGD